MQRLQEKCDTEREVTKRLVYPRDEQNIGQQSGREYQGRNQDNEDKRHKGNYHDMEQ